MRTNDISALTPPDTYREDDAGLARESSLLFDAAAIAAILTIAIVWYLPRLGFYSDDWAYMAELSRIPDASFADRLHRILQHDGVGRPSQFLLLALFFDLFGAAPLAYHAANAVFVVAGSLLFHDALRMIGVPRRQAIAAPVLFAMLPHYAAARFWVATVFCTTLSMALYFASLAAMVRALTGRSSRAGWWVAAAVAAAGSALSYEIFMPLIVASPAAIWYGRRFFTGRQDIPADRAIRMSLLLVLVLAPVVIYKLAVTPRGLRVRRGVFHQAIWFGMSLAGATMVTVGDFGALLPVVVHRLWVQHASTAALAIAALCGALLYALLAQPPGAHEDKRMSRRTGVGITVAGVLAYCAGYAVFLPLGGVSLTSSSGVNTRLATAAAVGVALLWTGVLTWGAARLSAARPQRTFAVAASVLLATVVSINGVFAECWMEAARRQQRVVAAIRRDVPIFPEGVTLLVDGMCPYVGPAPVFESQYDLAGALQFGYARGDIRADVITSRTVVGDAGVVNEFYGEISTYPYGNLRVYNLDTGTVYPIQNAPAARRYFESVNRQGTVPCPPGIPGKGTRLF